MTLTLEQVRQTRFHLARRNGYEPVDVDNFVDKVEATLSQLTEENETLKQQVEALSSSEPSSIFVPSDSGEADGLRSELSSRQGELTSVRGELNALRAELQGKNDEVARLQAELAAKTREAESLSADLSRLSAADQSDSPKGKVENIVVTTSSEASPAVARLLQMATEQAERLVGESQIEAQRLVSDARGEAETVIDNANRKAHETLTDARTRADRIESEARINAENVTREAQSRADAVNQEVEQHRTELFSQLEAERDTLRGKVDHLRQFESNYRANLSNHLNTQLRALDEATLEPGGAPAILGEPGTSSATPRLDALLGD
ncbi:MAG: DivIVA domain-containing protein [Propionicimonas sp.]|uniref:DivIVA domain-containing protein n=1 Tax=Propionicimonas sp. TaxID=1955623 RepID=UPI002B210EB1|nr:DivIVA domain-containing protein [Propionicimonas sp.]MEA4943001.1 DivIVA domain-containing protein [Propionicimonas sp.]MEA5118419.1 DivIVA domain-containing protein [Propionicimonas sp.]